MTVFLASSICIFGGSHPILNPANGFIDRLREVMPQQIKCLFVCSDPDGFVKTDHYAEEMEQAFQEAGFSFSQLTVLDRRNAWEADRWIRWSNVIILAGGHVPTQNSFFLEIGLADLLRDYSGVIIGSSAGSMNSAAMVYAHPELEGEAVDPDYRRFLPGLGLTSLNILPHYQQWKEETLDGLRLLEDIAYGDSFGHCFLILVDGSYVYIQDGRTEIIGEAYSLENGVCRKICMPGDRLVLEKKRPAGE